MALTLVVKSVNPVDRRALVISSEDEEVFRVLDFVCKEKTDGFERLFAAIHVIAQEEVIGFWWETAIFEQPQ